MPLMVGMQRLIVLSILALMIINIAYPCNSNSNFKVEGYVIDENGKILKNVQLYAFKMIRSNEWKLISKGISNENGYYNFELNRGKYRIYAILDLNETIGFDYAISFVEIEVNRNIMVNITLIEGASIIVEGEALIADSPEPAKYATYYINMNITNKLMKSRVLMIYGSKLNQLASLGLPNNLIVVPANMNITIIVEAYFLIGRIIRAFNFTLTEKPLKLGRGEKVTIKVTKSSLRYSLNKVIRKASYVRENITEAERKGFYIKAYKSKFNKALNLIENAEKKFQIEAYEQCYNDLREAYLILDSILRGINQINIEAYSSVFSMIFFITLMSITIGEILTERRLLKTLISITTLMVAFILLQIIYPGCKLVSLMHQLSWIFISYITFTLIIIVMHFIESRSGRENIGSIIFSIFSIAKRNLRRRKVRAILTILSILIIIGGFVALTSISAEEGLIMKVSSWSNDFRGIVIIRSSGVRGLIKFIPIKTSLIDDFSIKNRSDWYSIKYEFNPQINPLDFAVNLINWKIMNPIYSIISFSNDNDYLMRKMAEKLIEGRLIHRNGEVILTKDGALTLGVNVGDEILLLNSKLKLRVVGIVSNDFLDIIDLDGRSIRPYKLIIMDGENPVIETIECNYNEVLILWWSDAIKLGALPSRLMIHMEKDDNIISFARRIALTGEYKAIAYTSNKAIEYVYGSYLHLGGLETLIILAISIANIAIVMISSVYERKREIAILSALGLNPSHIALLFTVEALIIGVIGGGLGYLFGLSLYEIAHIFNVAIEVYPKISASWTTITVILAVITVIAGTIPALKSSIIVTPSKLMKWKVDVKPKSFEEPWIFYIPIRIDKNELSKLISFVYQELKRTFGIEGLKFINKNHLKFIYYIREPMSSSSSINELLPEIKDNEIKIKLIVRSYGEKPEKHAYEVARLVRFTILRWRSTSPSN